ncbi:MAG: response regulator transcription factor [Anaerolineae bacterium]
MAYQRPSDRWLADAWGLHYGFRPSPRILVVEDEGYIARSIAYPLEHVGYEVLACGRAWEALGLIEQVGLPHGAVIDLTLPDMAGEAVCKWMNAFSDIPTIVLLPTDASEALSQSTRSYADEWLRKPLESRHLVRRVQWLMHHFGDSSLPLAPLVQVDDAFAVDFVHQRMLLRGREVALSPPETKLMHILMRHPGCVVSTEFLASRLERAKVPDKATEEAVHAIVKALQHKIEAIWPGMHYIHAVAPSNYMFAQPEAR